ncbi:MAG TPA: FkbM family methyltransferase [Candidatus Kapabacteria bacterium]|nr:FkbM family methyltransferase [Candidatus Kapabacteria bacterium]
MIKNIIAGSKNPAFLPIKMFYYYLFNKYYEINNLIDKIQINDDKSLYIVLKNSIKLLYKPYTLDADINFTERYKYGQKSKMDKILNVEKYYFIYDLMHEIYVKNDYFKFFNIKTDDVVLDAGANIGLFTVLAGKKLNNTGMVIAVEPDDNNFEMLQANIELNNLKNISPYKKGLWSKNTNLEFLIGNRPGEHSLIDNEQSSGKKVVIECVSLDSLLDTFAIPNFDFIKMDIEGAEIEVVLNSIKVLENTKTKWVIEALHSVDGVPAFKKIIPFLQKNNFKILSEADSYRGTIYAVK